MDGQAKRAPRDLLGGLAAQERRERRGRRVLHRRSLDRPAIQGQVGSREPVALLDPQGKEAPQELQVPRETRVAQDLVGALVQLAILEQLA